MIFKWILEGFPLNKFTEPSSIACNHLNVTHVNEAEFGAIANMKNLKTSTKIV